MAASSALTAAASLASPWARCTQRAPPSYDATPFDHVKLGPLGVATGDIASDFSLPMSTNTSSLVGLKSLLATKPVFLQFGAYT